MKKGQVTVFIIIGIVLLLILGLVLYFTGRAEEKAYERAKPRLAELPSKIAPIRDATQTCIRRLATDALWKIGATGGYLDTQGLFSNPVTPTEGNAIEYTPRQGPKVSYWWHMSSANDCTENCKFESERPALRRGEGVGNIESQIDKYVNENLPDCVLTLKIPGCTVQQIEEPKILTHVTDASVYFDGKYPLRATCEDQSAVVDDYYVDIRVKLAQIYDLATEITNFQIKNAMLEQATLTILQSHSGRGREQLPPFRDLEFGPPSLGSYWIKYEVAENLKDVLTATIPLIQAVGAKNYNYVIPRKQVRDKELFELVYNRQFALPLNKTYPQIETRFAYLPEWEPYFDLNCNGQFCGADSGTNFYLLPFSINRYEFAYDLSYPVLVELRQPDALEGKDYVFQFFLEQNLRNSAPFNSDTKLPQIEPAQEPSIFCNPDQRTSALLDVFVKDADSLRAIDGATISYICGKNNCNLGQTANGSWQGRLPRCIGGALRVTKPDYRLATEPLDTFDERERSLSIELEPIKTYKARIKIRPITKREKYDEWKFEQALGLLRPPAKMKSIVMLSREGTEFEEPFVSVTEITGSSASEIRLVPGKYNVTIISMLHDDLKIPADRRCQSIKKVFSSDRECFNVPENPILFNETHPLPYGTLEYEYEFTKDALRGADTIEFRQFVVALDRVEEEDRIVEDLSALEKINLYSASNPILIWPKIS
ncbi:hypothetical protein D6825_00235 [Candidatus Woesearchaeota archaeon]|nr:MAG: hypothetical protein D6825_00235 [Candidatus Woesearchaeota archaeon]